MVTPLRVLIVEDSEDDTLLLMRELRRSGYEPTFAQVDTAADMRVVLAGGGWEVVLADYAMPRFSALAALEVLRQSDLDLPFIVVSGAIGEEVAVALMKAGAHDYVMKGNLARLGAAIHRELKEARMRRERIELEARLERAKRLETLGQLAGGVAHDLNNMLGPLVAYPELLLDALPDDSLMRQDLVCMQEAAERAAAVVQDLLTLARRETYRMTPLRLNDVVEQYLRSPSLADLTRRYPDVKAQVRLSPDLLFVAGSPPHLSKVVMNLVSNAFEAMPSGGTLEISTNNETLDQSLLGYSYVHAGDYVVLRVGDTGVGIEPEDEARIFEPFYTKKEMGRSGSGLGLTVVYGVVHDHGGQIDLHSEVGVGTTFTVYLPITREVIAEVNAGGGDYRGTETVLVVDDQEEQRQIAQRLLSCLGYRVAAAQDGYAALSYLRENKADIVVLDMIMADCLDGLETYREIVKIQPDQRAIIASGFSETDRVKEAQGLGAGQFLKKPYTLERIARAIREELDNGMRNHGVL